MDIKWEDKKANFDKARKLISNAVGKNTDLVCFPELFTTGVTNKPWNFSEDEKGETFDFLSKVSKENGIFIIGSFVENIKGKSRNACMAVDSSGKMIFKYNKIHPFTFDGEQKTYEPGSTINFFKLKGAKCTAFICYDLRFPEVFRIAALNGAEICFVVANWPYPRQAHWESLLKARAIENQMYIIGANRVGESPFNKYFGLSQIIDFQGNVLAKAKEASEDVIFADIDIEAERQWRRKFPCLNDVRNDLYKKIMADMNMK